MGIDPGLIVDAAGFADTVLRQKASGLSIDIAGDLRKDMRPTRCIKRRIVDFTNKLSEALIFFHLSSGIPINKSASRCGAPHANTPRGRCILGQKSAK